MCLIKLHLIFALMLCKRTSDLFGREWGAEKRKSYCKDGQNGKEEEEEEDDYEEVVKKTEYGKAPQRIFLD